MDPDHRVIKGGDCTVTYDFNKNWDKKQFHQTTHDYLEILKVLSCFYAPTIISISDHYVDK